MHWRSARAQLPRHRCKQDCTCASSADQSPFLLPEWASIGSQAKIAGFCVPSNWSAWSSSVFTRCKRPTLSPCPTVLQTSLCSLEKQWRGKSRPPLALCISWLVGGRRSDLWFIFNFVYLDWVHSKLFCSYQDVIFFYGGCFTVQPFLDKSLT